MDESIDLEEYKILKNDNFIYRDLSPKLNRNKLIGYESAFDVEAIKNSLKNIFLVQKGQMPGKPQFGNPLRISLFDNFDFASESSLKQAIKVEVEKYEPRVIIQEIKISEMPEYNRLIIEIIFYVILKEGRIEDSIYLPFSHNDFTYIGGRTTS